MIRTAIYMRVSTDRQAQEGDSIPAQREALHKYIESHPDMEFAGEYLDDGISGTKYERDELQRLLADVEADKIDLIAVTKMDRLHRSLRNFLNMQDILDRHKCNWVAIWEPMYDTTTPQGRMVVNTMMNLAQFEAEQTGQRIKQVFSYKTAQGEVCSGSTPPGYSIKDKHLVPNDDAKNVLFAFETFAETNSLHKTMRRTQGLSGIPTYTPSFKRMLMNTKYIGEHEGNTNYCTPLIAKELFEFVQRGLTMNVKKSQKYDYVFTGLVVCKDCGRHMGGSQRKRTPQHGEWHERFYRCPAAFHPNRLCVNRKVVGEHAIEKLLISAVGDKMKTQVEASFVEEEPQDYSAQIKNVKRKIDRLKELYINDLLTIEEYKADKEDLLSQLEELESLQKPSKMPSEPFLSADVITLYQSFSNAEKRQFWRSLVRQIMIDKDRNISISFFDS